MQCVKSPKRNSRETVQKIACSDSMLIFQRVDLKKSQCNIFLECCRRLPLHVGINLTVSTTTAKKALQLDYGKAADRDGCHSSKKRIEFVRSGFMQIPLGQSARINVSNAVQRCSRS